MFRDLLATRGFGPLLRSPWTWRLLRLTGLVLLLAMAAYGWHQHAIPGIEVRDPLMYTNLANHLFWVWWLMGVVFIALFLGRAWCAVCPLGWINGIVARFGLQRPVPRWLANFAPVTLVLVALQLAVYFLAIHRFPDYTARLLALMLLLAVLAGLVFRKRAFCSLLCPAGAVFGLYARLAPFQLRVKNRDVCAACSDRECVSGGEVWKRYALGRGVFYWRATRNDCPVDLVPAQIEESTTCTLCLHCADNCTRKNILLGRRPWLADLGTGLKPSESLFFVVLLGMLTANFSKVYVDLRELVFWLPQQGAALLGWEQAGFSLLATLWVTLAFPLLLLMPGYLVLKVANLAVSDDPPEDFTPAATISTDEGFWSHLGRLALPMIPMVLAAHVVLAVVKINAKGAYLPLALGDPSGVKSYLALNVMQTMQAPGVVVSLDILKWIVLGLLAAGYALSLIAGRRVAAGFASDKAPNGFYVAALINVTLVAGLYGATVIRWLFVR